MHRFVHRLGFLFASLLTIVFPVRATPHAVADTGIGTITLSPTTAIPNGATITVTGAEWLPGLTLDLYQCASPAALGNCAPLLGSAVSEADGFFTSNVVVSAWFDDGVGWFTDCSAAPNGCSIVATTHGINPTALATAALDFADTTVAISSNYDASEASTIIDAAAALGLSPDDYQRASTWALTYLLGYSNITSVDPIANAGAVSVTTQYPGPQYAYLHATASRLGVTDAEFQKLGALAIAFVLSL